MRRAETQPPTLEYAIALAGQAHRGQIYLSLAGEPYILHPLGALLRLTHRAEDTCEDYIRWLQDHPLARWVKRADLAENLANTPQQEPDAEHVARVARCDWAQAMLLAASGAVRGVGSVGSRMGAGV